MGGGGPGGALWGISNPPPSPILYETLPSVAGLKAKYINFLILHICYIYVYAAIAEQIQRNFIAQTTSEEELKVRVEGDHVCVLWQYALT